MQRKPDPRASEAFGCRTLERTMGKAAQGNAGGGELSLNATRDADRGRSEVVPSAEEQLAGVQEQLAVEQARGRAQAGVTKLSDAVDDYQRRFVHWLGGEVGEFVRGTGGNAALSLTGSQWEALVRGVSPEGPPPAAGAGAYVARKVGNRVFGDVAKAGLVKASGSSLGNVAAVARWSLKGLGGFVVGTAISMVFDLLLKLITPSPSRDELEHLAGERMGAQFKVLLDALMARLGDGAKDWRADRNDLLGWVAGPHAAVAELDALVAWCGVQAKRLQGLANPAARSVELPLLERWVHEHAGDDESAGEATNQASWTDAVVALELAKSKKDQKRHVGQHGYALRDGRLLKATLYEDQCRREWASFGFDFQPAVASLTALLRADVVKRPRPAADSIGRRWQHEFVGTRDWERWKAAFRQATGHVPSDNAYFVTVRVELEQRDYGATFVKAFHYDVRTPSEPVFVGPGGQKTHMTFSRGPQ